MNELLIDVIIPVYNGEKFIQAAVNSVQQQSWQNLRILIVDDCSTDGTLALLEILQQADVRIVTMQQQHKGTSAALNKALLKSTADYIAFIDADDVWHPDKLKMQMDAMETNHKDICFTLIEGFNTPNPLSDCVRKGIISPLKGFLKTSMLIHRRNFEKYGNFNENVKVDFLEWFSRLIRDDKSFLMLDEVLAYRRVHKENATRFIDKNEYLKMLKAHIDAGRQTARSI